MKFKRYIIFVVLAVFTLTLASPVFAETSVSSNSATQRKAEKKTERLNDKMATTKARALQEIDRRIASLTRLIEKINGFKRISAEQKTTLTNQVQTEINNLTALKAKIDADTDVTTLQTDVKSIVSSYRIYALFMPKIEILAATEILATGVDEATSISAKLQVRITALQAEGKDITAVQSMLNDMQTKIQDAKTQYQNAQSTVISLTPEGYPGNKSSLESARTMVKTARQDLVSVRDSAKKIIQAIREKGK